MPDIDETRAARNDARSRMDRRFSALKGGYADKGIGERVGEKVTGKIKGTAQDLGNVARESKGVIAGALGLLGLWFARRPIMSLGSRWWSMLRARIDKDF